jgi:hypothetical protein
MNISFPKAIASGVMSLAISAQVFASNSMIRTESEEREILFSTEISESRQGYGLELNLNRVISDLEKTVDNYRENMSRGGKENAEEAIRLIAREISVLIQTINQGRTGTLAHKGLHRVQIVSQGITPLESAFISFIKDVSKKDIEVIAFSKKMENKRASAYDYQTYAAIMRFYADLAQKLKQAADDSRSVLLASRESWEEKKLKTLDADEENQIDTIVAFADDLIGPLDRLYTRIGWTTTPTDAVLAEIEQEEVIKSKFLWFGEKVVLKNPTHGSLNESLNALRQSVAETMVAFGMALMEVKDTQMSIDYRAEASKASFSVFTRLAEKISEERSENWNHTAHRDAMLTQIDTVSLPAAHDLMMIFSNAKKTFLRSQAAHAVSQ